MQIQKRMLELFAVIESPILVFSAQKDLIYALWPHFVGSKYHGRKQRQDIMTQAQYILSSWQYSVGEPLFLAQVDTIGGILLPNNIYVLIGPILPIKVTIKHKLGTEIENIVDYVENRTACLACNMWLKQMCERSKFMVHEIQQSDEQDHRKRGLEASSSDDDFSFDFSLNIDDAITNTESRVANSSESVVVNKAGSNSLTGMIGVDSAIEVGIELRDSFSYMTLEQFVAGKGIDEGNWSENYELGLDKEVEDKAKTKPQAVMLLPKSQYAIVRELALGAGAVDIAAKVESATELSGFGIKQRKERKAKQSEIDSLLQSLSGKSNYDFSQIYAAQNETYNPMDGSSANEIWVWDDKILDLLHIDHIGTVHHHNQLRNEVLVQEAVREGDVEKLRWAYNLAPKGKSGVLGLTPLRSWKNHAHIANIFASRAAIDAGISPEEAYTMSDKLFLAVESIKDPLLAKHMRFIIYRAFTEQVRWHKDRLQKRTLDRIEPLLVQKARFLLQQQLFTHVSLQSLAEQLGCSAEHLARCFKCYHGQSVMQFLKRERLTRAKELLRESNIKICDIAALLHFASSAHFCQAFKAQEHLSPAKWRALYAKFTEV